MNWWGGLTKRLRRRGYAPATASNVANAIREDIQPFLFALVNDPRVHGTTAEDAVREVFKGDKDARI